MLDLSCRKRGENYFVVTDRWQKFTELIVNEETLQKFSGYCAEFLIHAVDVEGLCSGIDGELVAKLGRWTPIPMTYAGGAKSISDLAEVTRLGGGKVDLTIGSALDIFGGHGVKYEDCVQFNRCSLIIIVIHGFDQLFRVGRFRTFCRAPEDVIEQIFRALVFFFQRQSCGYKGVFAQGVILNFSGPRIHFVQRDVVGHGSRRA